MLGRHIAIVAPPVPGHYDPLKVLARALEAKGHRVTFVHMFDAGALLDGFGFGFCAVGARSHGPGALRRYTDILARAARPLGFLAMIRATAAVTRMLLDELPDALAAIGADAVIADSTEPAGGVVARHLRLPWASSVTGLPLLREPSVPPPFIGWPFGHDDASLKRNETGYRISDWLSRPIDRVLRERGDRWGLDPAEHGGFSSALQVTQCPPGLDFPRQELPEVFHYTGPWRAPVQAIKAPQSDRPLVYCSLGSLQGNRPALFAAMSEACSRVGARAVVAHGGRLRDERLPGDPIVRARWDQPSIVPHCSAAILHGGFNTVLDALTAGVPMLLRPIAFEQPGTAARVVHHGAGRLLTGRISAARIAEALAGVLASNELRGGARRFADEMSALGGVERAADLIDALFRRS
jgi:zeaxanthin glucosyltransferase